MKNKRGFTLMEIVVVIAVSTLLMGVALPSLMQYNQNARELERTRHEELVSRALRQYYAYEGAFPDPDPYEVLPISGTLTQAQAETLKAQIEDVTGARIDVSRYTYSYNESTGDCLISLK